MADGGLFYNAKLRLFVFKSRVTNLLRPENVPVDEHFPLLGDRHGLTSDGESMGVAGKRAQYRTLSASYIERLTEDEDPVEIDMGRTESGEIFYHCHSKESPPGVDLKARRVLIIASIICLLFMICEIVGGILARSLAIITDAAHLLTDFASFLISLFSLYVAARPATKKMSFGWHRAEVLGAFVSVLMIWVVTGVLVYMAVERIVNEEYEIDAKVMLITAAIGVTVNIIMGALLYGSGHGHSHGGGGGHGHSHGGGGHGHSHGKGGHSHGGDAEVGVEGRGGGGETKNINVRAALIHVIGDLFQSLGVLLAATIIYFRPDLAVLDPVCTFIFSGLVLITTVAILRDALRVLMEGIPRGVDFEEVTESLMSIPGVQRVHNLRIWSLTMDKMVFSVHLASDPDANAQEILKAATLMLQKDYGVYESTIQIEKYTGDMENCVKCEQPKP